MYEDVDARGFVRYEDIEKIYTPFLYWSNKRDGFWYKKMWNIMENQGLTVYDDEESYYKVIFRAVTILLIYSDYLNIKYRETDLCSTIYGEVLYDYIPESALTELYYQNTQETEDDKEYEVRYIANSLRGEVVSAINNEIGKDRFFFSFYAVEHVYKRISDGREDTIEPCTAEEFWKLYLEHMEEIIAGAESFSLDVGTFIYNWVVNGCSEDY